MRKKNNLHIGMEVDENFHYKLQYIAQYEGRSINGLILKIIRDCVKAYEAENGEIKPSKTEE